MKSRLRGGASWRDEIVGGGEVGILRIEASRHLNLGSSAADLSSREGEARQEQVRVGVLAGGDRL